MPNTQASLLSHLVADYGTPPAFVDRTYGEPLFHTESEVLALRYAPDETLWTVEEAGVLRHFAADGRLLEREFLSDVEDVWAFNRDASYLASGTSEIALWDPAGAVELGRAEAESWITAIAFSPDSKILAAGHDDGRVSLWKLPSLTRIGDLEGHDDAVSALAFTADGTQLTTAGDDHRIRVWDVKSKTLVREWKGHTDRVPGLAWHPSGEFLISVGWDTTARVWEPGKDDPAMLLNAHSDQVNAVAESPDGGLLACADSDFTIHVWDDPRRGRQKFVLNGHTDEIRALAFNDAGTRLASAGADRVVHIWDMATGKLVAGPNPSARNSIAVAGNTLFSTGGNLLQGFDRDSGKRAWPVTDSEAVYWVAASPDASRLVTTGPTPDARVWDVAKKSVVQTLSHTKGPIGSPAFSSDGQFIATASVTDGLLWVWKLGTPEAILVIPEAADACTLESVAFHPNGKYVAVGGLDWLATSGNDGALCVWDLEARDKHLTLEAGVTAVTFDAAGRYLAAGTFSQTGQSVVVVWDFDKQEKVFDLPGHHDRINAVAFSPDGSWLVSGGDDSTIRVWNVLTGRLAVARQFDAAVQSLAFSPDGKYLFTGNGNTTAYRLEMKKMLEE
jgi:WD40 repeat protein